MSITITADRKEKFAQIGCFRGGHNQHVLSLGTLSGFSDRLLSTSRDKSLLIWKLDNEGGRMNGTPYKRYTGHSHFVSDVTTSSDSRHCITSSWDHNLRLWDLEKGVSTRTFIGHTNDVLSVEFSSDNRQIISGGRDKTVKVWNTLGRVAFSSEKDKNGHSDWISGIGISTSHLAHIAPSFVSASWDSTIKFWNPRTYAVERTLKGHGGAPFTCMNLSPDSSICAAGTKDGVLMAWNLENLDHTWTFGMPVNVNAIAFCPHQFRICVGAGSSIYVYDLATRKILDEVTVELPTSTGNKITPAVTILKWNTDGTILFAGYTDGCIRAWKLLPVTTFKMSQDE